MAEQPKQAPAAKPGGQPTGKEPKPWMAVVGVLLLVGGIAWMIYGIVTYVPPKKPKGGH